MFKAKTYLKVAKLHEQVLMQLSNHLPVSYYHQAEKFIIETVARIGLHNQYSFMYTEQDSLYSMYQHVFSASTQDKVCLKGLPIYNDDGKMISFDCSQETIFLYHVYGTWSLRWYIPDLKSEVQELYKEIKREEERQLNKLEPVNAKETVQETDNYEDSEVSDYY